MKYDPSFFFNVQTIEQGKMIVLNGPTEEELKLRWSLETFHTISTLKKLSLPENPLILDYGCGIGRLSKEMIEQMNATVVGIDISPSMLQLSFEYVMHDKFIPTGHRALQKIIENGLKFDLVVAVWVLQHARNPIDDILLIKSCLRENGLFYCVNCTERGLPTDIGFVDDKNNIEKLLDLNFEPMNKTILPKTVPMGDGLTNIL